MKKIFALFTAAALILAGCSDLNVHSNENQVINIQNKAWVCFNLKGDARTILPSNIDKEDYTYQLFAQKEGEENKLLGTYTGYTVLKQAFSSKIEIFPGNYTFTLKANTELGTALIAETQKQVTTGENTVSFAFEKVAAGTGNLEVEFVIPLDGAEKVTAQLCTLAGTTIEGYSEEELELTDTAENSKVVYKKQNVPCGDYVVKFFVYLNASDTEWIDVKTEVVKVAVSNQTNGQLKLDGINEYFTIEYELNGGEWADGFTPVTKLNKKQAVILPVTSDLKINKGVPFYEWYDNEGFLGEPVTIIDAGATENKKYYAKYAIACEVSELTSKLQNVTADRCTVVITDQIPSCSEIANVIKSSSIKVDLNLSKCTQLTLIGDSAFSGCSRLTSVTIPDSVTSIGEYAFVGCSVLTSVTIPDSVTSIGDFAFDGCSGLTSVTIPDSVTSIGDYAFNGCSNLKDIYISNVETWCKISGLKNLMYYGTFNKNLYLNGTLINDLVIPDGVTSIGDYAFRGCSGLTSVTIPDSVTSIGDYAFSGCSGLTSVTIPDSVIYIGYSAFYGCSGLTSVTIPDGVTSIDYYAFEGCSGLTSVTIPNSVTSIGECAFGGCSGLTSVTIPDSVTSIGKCAFYSCSKLKDIYISNVETFCKISGLKNLMLYGTSNKNLYLNGTLITDLVIPDGISSIGDNAFDGCSGLTSVTIPDSVTSIGDWAFSEVPHIYYTGSATGAPWGADCIN